jgi:NTP pyrophosphatase (non-canonical NTP hydrolase)
LVDSEYEEYTSSIQSQSPASSIVNNLKRVENSGVNLKNKNPYLELGEFVSYSEEKLEVIQNYFDDYQKRFFGERTGEFFCLELNGEAGELANLEKKKWKGKDIEMTDLADEAADVFIALMNYSNARGIDLGSAVKRKLERIEKKRLKLANEGIDY